MFLLVAFSGMRYVSKPKDILVALRWLAFDNGIISRIMLELWVQYFSYKYNFPNFSDNDDLLLKRLCNILLSMFWLTPKFGRNKFVVIYLTESHIQYPHKKENMWQWQQEDRAGCLNPSWTHPIDSPNSVI